MFATARKSKPKCANQRNFSCKELREMIASNPMPTVASEVESLTVAIPTTQSKLHYILATMAEKRIDQFGNDRLVPSNVVPGKKVESKGFLPRLTGDLSKNDEFNLKEFIPRISDDEVLIIPSEEVILPMPPIFYGRDTSVFNIANDPGKVIRYHLHYQPLMTLSIDETLYDYWFLKRLELSDIAPKIYYYSAPLMSPPDGLMKTCSSTYEKANYISSMRYVIMEKVGLSIHRYVSKLPDKKTSFTDAIRIGGQMIRLAEKLHSYDIVHGDAHLGNFAIHKGKIIMIDFGRAKIMSPSELSERHCAIKRDFWISPRVSPWEMQRHLYSYRDDVYRIIQGIAFNMYGVEYSDYLDHIHDFDKIPNEYVELMMDYAIHMKVNGSLFEIPKLHTSYRFPHQLKTSFSLDGIVAEDKIDEVRRLLREIMNEVLKVNVFSKPSYAAIKQKLVDILIVVEGTTNLEPSIDINDFFNMEFTT